MIRVGLTGGYATGKSFVAAELERLSCELIHADKLGHQALEPDGEAYLPAIKVFGEGILDASGRIDRKKLGAMVFGEAGLLEKLTAIVHPAVFRLEEQHMRSIGARHPAAIAVVEAAILIETGRYKVFDRLILTTCEEALQIQRGMRRDGLSAEEIRARLNEQMPFSEKRPYANYIVDTSGAKEHTLRRVEEIYRELDVLARSSV